MNERGGVVTFFVFLLLAVVILLQILSMVQSDRFYKCLNRLDETFALSGSESTTAGKSDVNTVSGEEYHGDEGDWLIWAFHAEPKTLNPISADTDIYATWITIPYIFEPLLAYDYDDMKLKPWLAESYNVSDDGLEITFRLRDNIWFSDGVPVTSDDVIFTYQTIIDPKVDAANVANQYVDVKDVVKIDDRNVKFFMKRPHFKSLVNLSLTWTAGVLPKHIYQFRNAEEFNKHLSNPVGSGPYVFEKWDVGREIVLRRNENYWGQKPKLHKMIYKFIPNDAASLQALRSHQVDILIPDAEQFADLANDKEFNEQFYRIAYWTPDTPFFFIGWNMDTPFFSDRRVRLAMTHLVNRRQIVDNLLKGYGRIVTGPFYINGTENDPNIQPWPYDLEKARQLLDEAGWRDTDGDGLRDKDGVPFRFRFSYSVATALYDRLAKLLKDDAAKVGIEVIPEPYEWSILVGRLNDRKFEATVMGWGGDILQDHYQIFHSSQIGNRGSNFVGFRNPQADAIMEEARKTLDDDKRNELYRRLHRILHDEQPYTFLFTRPVFRLVDKRFKNVIVHNLGFKYLEWYVPKNEQRYK